jgi:hypothetical protein
MYWLFCYFFKGLRSDTGYQNHALTRPLSVNLNSPQQQQAHHNYHPNNRTPCISPHSNTASYQSSKPSSVSNENEKQNSSFVKKQDTTSSDGIGGDGGPDTALSLSSKSLKQFSPSSNINLTTPVSALSILNIQTNTAGLTNINKTPRDHIHSSISPISSSNKRPRLLMSGDEMPSINNGNSNSNSHPWVVSNSNSWN